MTVDHEIELLRKLDTMRVQHRTLDHQIFALQQKKSHDKEFVLFGLKRQKAMLKYQIAQIEKTLYPDSIA